MSWWQKKPKTEKEIKKEEMIEHENSKLKLVQQIRLYFHHFDFLKKLHIVPVNKKTNEPEVEKYLISLYTKKELELEKILHFIKWHTRNDISQSSTKIFDNVAETILKTSEHFMVMMGVKVQGLTEKCMADEDIRRCLKEVQIEHGISTISYGPKTDLAINICSTIARVHGENAIQEQILLQSKKQENQQQKQIKELENMASVDVQNKYKDL